MRISAQLRITEDHYLYTAASAGIPFAARVAKAAGEVAPGEHIWRVAADGGAVSLEQIAAVEWVQDTGLVSSFIVRGAPPCRLWRPAPTPVSAVNCLTVPQYHNSNPTQLSTLFGFPRTFDSQP